MTALALPGISWRSILHRAAQRQRALMALQSPLAATRQVSGPLARGRASVAAGPTTLILDQFTANNGTAIAGRTPLPTNTPGGTWSQAAGGTWQIQSNVARQTTAASATRCYISTGVSDCTISCDAVSTISNPTAPSYITGVLFRRLDSSNYWSVGINFAAGLFYLYEINAGAVVLRASAGSAPASGTIACVLSGNSITATLNGGFTLNYSSSFLADQTVHGFRGSSIGDTIDNWQVTVP